MSRYRKFTMIAAVATLAFGLAACGSSDDDQATVTDPPVVDPTPDPAIAQRATIGSAIDAATAAVAVVTDAATDDEVADAETAIAAATAAIAVATDVPAHETAANSATVAVIGTTLSNAKTSRMAALAAAAAAMKTAMAAAGKALHEALGTDPLGILESTRLSTALVVTPTEVKDKDGKSIPGRSAATLTAGDSAGALGAWNGTHYSKTNTGTKVTNSAVVYTNRADPTMKTFATGATLNMAAVTDQTRNPNAYSAKNRTLALAKLKNVVTKDIAGAMFPTAGTQTFTVDPVTKVAVIPGTYQGASGSYACTDVCKAKWNSSGISLKEGMWSFVHDVGAMVSIKDASYLYFGWWLRTDDTKDEPKLASAFTGVSDSTEKLNEANLKDVTGSATYAGSAAGKFSINDPINGGDAGDFTADATLSAKFGDAVDAGISGTVDTFMANEQAVPWSVALKHANWSTSGGGGAFELKNAGTVWSIDGKSAAASGSWKGTMYDEADKDGSDVPTSVTGVFHSEVGSTHSMVGAFGATK